MESINADVLIVTVTPVESRAVLQAFKQATGNDAKSITVCDRVYRDLGTVNGAKVFMALSEMGAGGLGAAQQAVQKGIAALQPHAVIMVGIAFGVNEKKQAIGDILVSKQLMLYESQRVGVGEIISRGDKAHSAARLVNYLQNAYLDWDGAEVRFGLVLTGEKLVDDLDYRESLKKLESEAIGGEMEGAGLYVSCQDAKVDWILVKAICDWADGNKDHDKRQRQQQAAENATAFVLHALQHAPLPRLTPLPNSKDKGNVNGGNQRQSDITVNIMGSTVDNSVVIAEQVNKTEIHLCLYPEKTKQENTSYQPKINSSLRELDDDDFFVGRSTKLKQLNNALNSNDISIICIIAAGGIGKTTLIQKWLSDLNKSDYKIFARTFYNQGTNNDSQTSSTPFFLEAFKFFNSQSNANNEPERGRELANLIQQQPTIIVLDGLEPLQYSEKADNGFLKDPAIDAFLTSSLNAQLNKNSLIVISTRQPLTRFVNKKGYNMIDLLKLDEPDAVQLLKNLGVTKGLDKEFIEAVNFYGCHALALMLLGRMIVKFFNKDICHYREIPLLKDRQEGKHTEKILNFYVNYWQDNEPEKLFLYLLGLFDRPMNQEERKELFEKATIAKPLAILDTFSLKEVIENLQYLKLLTDDNEYYDCHPIIRNYFGLKLKENYPEEFKQAHSVLFDYYQKIPKKDKPETLEEMLPLYQAVVHGCLAEQYQQAYNVYFSRIDYQYLEKAEISRGYASNKLGAYSQNLIALAAFFPLGLGNLPVQIGLTGEIQLSLLEKTSHYLTSLGRFVEARESAEKYLELSRSLDNKKDASNACRMLTNLYQPQGRLVDAESVATQAVEYAKSNAESLVLNLCRLAIVLHRKGEIENAESYFRQSDEIEQNENKQPPLYYSVSGFDYRTLQLDKAKNKGELNEIIKIGESANNEKYNNSFNGALGRINFARAYFALNDFSTAEKYFQQAMEWVQKANRIEFMPPFCLSRADFYLTQNQLDSALADLNSAWEIIERCDMKLYEVDYRLIHGRYSLATADFDTALNHYQEAKQLIEETGYHLRDAELDLFAAQICLNSESKLMSLDSKDANYYLQKAKKRIADIGQWGLMRVIERDFPDLS